MASGERTKRDPAEEANAAVTAAAIGEIDAMLAPLYAQLAWLNDVIGYHSRPEVPDVLADDSANRLETAYAEEAAVREQIEHLEMIQQQAADGCMGDEIAWYYAQAAPSETISPSQSAKDL